MAARKKTARRRVRGALLSPPAAAPPGGSREAVGRWVEHWASAAGERVALLDGERRLSYRELHERILRCAGLLAARGVGRGDRVAWLLGNRSAALEIVFAAARLGAIAVPVNARLTAPELRGILDDCEPHLLIHEHGLAEVAGRAAPGGLARLACGGRPDAYEAALSDAPRLETAVPGAPDDPMILMYTSGTTGEPKGALLPQRKTLYNSLNAEIFFGLTPEDRVLVVLPLFHSFALLILSIPALFAGARVVLQRRFDPAQVWSAVARHRITFFGGVPTVLQSLLETLEAGPRPDLSSLRFVFAAGAPVPVELIRAFARHGLALQQGFGQTETSILCCLDAADALRKAGSVGRPVAHGELRVVDLESLELPPQRWRDAPVGATGEIAVRGPITMLGYWRRPDASAEVLRDGWLRTGDLARVDEEGFLTLAGRSRDLFISGGENVYPAEVEAVFAEHPAVREIAVVGVPDGRWGEVGEAYVVPRPGARLDEGALLAWGRERLAPFKLPRRFVSVASLPRTETGKVQRRRLRDFSSR